MVSALSRRAVREVGWAVAVVVFAAVLAGRMGSKLGPAPAPAPAVEVVLSFSGSAAVVLSEVEALPEGGRGGFSFIFVFEGEYLGGLSWGFFPG